MLYLSNNLKEKKKKKKININIDLAILPSHDTDGTINKSGSITDTVDMNIMIEDHIERIQFLVTNLGKRDVFLGHK